MVEGVFGGPPQAVLLFAEIFFQRFQQGLQHVVRPKHFGKFKFTVVFVQWKRVVLHQHWIVRHAPQNGQQYVSGPPPTTAVAGVGHFGPGSFVLAPFVRPILGREQK